MPRQENIIEYLFRARDAQKVQQAAQDIVDAFSEMKPAASEAEGAIDRVEGEIDEFADASKKAGESAGFLDKLKASNIGQLAVGFLAAQAAVAVFREGLQKLRETFEFTVGKAAAQQDAVVRLENSMVSAGSFSRQASVDFQEFASSMQAVTASGDEETIALGALIAQIGKLRGQELERATKAALDMQAALGKTSQEVGIFLGKLAQGETGSLTEIGIVIDQTIPKSEKFLAGLEAIEAAFGGTAEATVKSYTGATRQLSNAWGDFGEAIGEIVLPELTRFAQVGAQAFSDLANKVRELTGRTQQSAEDLASSFSFSLQQMTKETKRSTEEFEEFVNTVSKKTELEIRLEIEKSSLEAAIISVESLETTMENATKDAEGTFDAFQERIRSAAAVAIEQKISLSAASAESEFRNFIAALTGDVSIDARIAGTPDALAAAEAIRAAADAVTDFDEGVIRARGNIEAFNERMAAVGIEAGDGILAPPGLLRREQEALDKALEDAIASAEDINKRFGGVLDNIRAKLEEAGGEAEIKLNIKTEIDAAQSIEEVDAIVAKADDVLQKASQAAQQQIGGIAIGEATLRVNEFTKQMAEARVETLRFQKQMEDLQAPTERVAALLVRLQQINVSSTFEDIQTTKMVEGVTDAQEAVSKLNEEMGELLERKDLSELKAAADLLTASIKASEDGVQGLDDELRQAMEENLARALVLLEAMSELEKERIITLRLNAKKAKKDADKESEDLKATFEKRMAEINLEGAETVFEGLFGLMDEGSEKAFSIMEGNFSSLIDAMIRDLQRLAAQSVFRFIVNLATSGGGNALDFLGQGPNPSFKVGGILETGGPPPGPSADGFGSPLRQFAGAEVRPPDPAIAQLLLTNQLLLAQQPRVVQPQASDAVLPFLNAEMATTIMHVDIRALDSADFERYMRDGPGARTVARLRTTGRSG